MFCLVILLSIVVTPTTFSQVSIPDDHAIYIAVIELEHQPNQVNARLQVKVFTSDLQDALKNKFNGDINLDAVMDSIEDSGKISAYFAEHLIFRINDQPAKYELYQITAENEAHWFYFALKGPQNWKKLDVMADFLMELFPKQSNIFQIKEGKRKLFYRLTLDRKSQSITFSD